MNGKDLIIFTIAIFIGSFTGRWASEKTMTYINPPAIVGQQEAGTGHVSANVVDITKVPDCATMGPNDDQECVITQTITPLDTQADQDAYAKWKAIQTEPAAGDTK